MTVVGAEDEAETTHSADFHVSIDGAVATLSLARALGVLSWDASEIGLNDAVR